LPKGSAAQQAAVCYTTRHINLRFIWWVNKATDTHSGYVTQISVPYQQLLRERASVIP